MGSNIARLQGFRRGIRCDCLPLPLYLSGYAGSDGQRARRDDRNVAAIDPLTCWIKRMHQLQHFWHLAWSQGGARRTCLRTTLAARRFQPWRSALTHALSPFDGNAGKPRRGPCSGASC